MTPVLEEDRRLSSENGRPNTDGGARERTFLRGVVENDPVQAAARTVRRRQ
jgi:hypothetical protein